MLTVTNAVKAQVIAAVNAILGLLAAFNVGGITDAQTGSIIVAVNAVLGLLVAVTYKTSSKRVPDGATVVQEPSTVVVAPPATAPPAS